jgi:nitroimidazol reductase NimA-like FMN-containing flavoprotein (pyridoxamine 5'-phosphate oxidase superfamily)
VFRELARKKQELSREECLELLRQEKRGVLSVLGDGGYPYGMPMNYLYEEETGFLCFHCGKTGHRLDALRRCDKASFCVLDAGERKEGDWALTFRSVIVFGRVRFVEDRARALELSRRLSLRFTDDTAYIEEEIRRSGPAVLCFALEPEHICGKRVHEA